MDDQTCSAKHHDYQHVEEVISRVKKTVFFLSINDI